MKKSLLYLLAICFAFLRAQAGNGKHPDFVSNRDVFGSSVFIENMGQFDNDVKSVDKIYYALISDQEKIYFTNKGVLHQLIKTYPLTERQEEALEQGEHIFRKDPDVFYVKMTWLNANADIQIESSQKQSHYFSYWSADLISHTYKKLTYKNVYNHIDIEYIIPDDKEQGVKYTVVLHPGADPDDVKIAYTGDVEKIKLNNAGDVVIKTPLENLTEHKPQSFYMDKEKVNSKFKLENNILKFSFPDSYNPTKTLYVDPWVTAVSTLSTNNSAYDVDYDDNGNVFVYGGSQSCKIAKYSAGGVLLWTFAGTLATPAWNSAGISNFVVMRSTGKCYAGQGVQSGGARIIRLDANGVYDNLITPAAASWNEVWDLAYHCSTGNVYGMGGSTTSNQSAGILNQSTGNLVPTNFIGPFNTSNVGNDVVNYAIDDAGEFFWIYASNFTPTLSNQMAKINSAFTTTMWVGPSGFNTLNEYSNKNQYIPNPGSSNGYNCLAVNLSYLYFYDGKNIAAYNKATGAQIASAIVPGNILKRQGGIAVDDCNNLYLGGNDTIKSLHFNGTSFTALPPVLIGVTGTTNAAVYDLKMDRLNATLYASGKGFVGVYGAGNSGTCTPLNIICYNPNPQDYVICAGKSLSLTPANFLNLQNPTYSLQPGSVSSGNGTLVVTPTANTNYTTYVTGTTTNNVVLTLTAAVNVTVYAQPITFTQVTQATCLNPNNSFNLNLGFNPSSPAPSYTITWSPIPNGIGSPTQFTCAGVIAGGSYTASILAANGCSTAAVVNINAQPEQATFSVFPASGYILNCYNPTLTLNYSPATLNYTTTNGLTLAQCGPTTAFTTTNAANVFTITAVHPTSGCIKTQTFSIAQNFALPTSVITPTFQNITCSLSGIATVSATINPTINVVHQWLSPLGGSLSFTSANSYFTPGTPGTFTHIALNSSNGCFISKTFTVASSSGFPTYTVVSPQNFTLGCNTRSVATINIVNAQTTPTPGGTVTYTILGPPSNSAYVPNGISTFTINTPGTWTLITRDMNSLCESKVEVSVLQNTIGPDVSVIIPSSILTCDQPSVTLQGQSTTPSTSFNWSFPGTPGNLPNSDIIVLANFANRTNTLIANYTLTVIDNNNTCITRTIVPMVQNLFVPNAIISGGSELTCSTTSISLTNGSSSNVPPIFTNGLPVVAYEWNGPSPQTPLQVSSTYVGTIPGTYTILVKDLNNGCFAVGTKTIADSRVYPSINKPSAPDAFILDCGATSRTITPNITFANSAYTYSWDAVPGATVSGTDKAILLTNTIGQYVITVTDTKNGCQSTGVVEVVNGSLKGDFSPDHLYGYAPMEVKFTNTSHSSIDSLNIISVWSFGNDLFNTTYSAAVSPTTIYQLAGTYTVTMYTHKGNCMDTVVKIISVEIPSDLEIPNVFTPNGDGVNDVFFLKANNLTEIKLSIYDRWGHKVFDETSDKGNIVWDGKNQLAKELPEGVYSYILTAKGKDDQAFKKNGTITLIR